MIRFINRLVKPRIFSCRIPKGRPGTMKTAAIIASMIRAGAKDFYVRQRAIGIFREANVPAKARRAEVEALFRWVQKNIRYTRDIFRVELLHTPRRMLELRAGDCDDMTILLGSMLLSTGHPVRLALTGFRADRPHHYSHIFPEAQVAGRWIPLDATMPHPSGWEPPSRWKRTIEV